MTENKIFVTVDSISDGFAALLLRGEKGETPLGVFPVSVLPEGTLAGDILSINFSKEEEMTRDARDRVRKLHEKLMERK